MLTLSEQAKQELKRIHDSRRLEPGKFLRLTAPPVWTGEGDFGIVIDVERQGDHVIQVQGSKVLLIDPLLLEQLHNAVVDFKPSPHGPRFTLDIY